MQDRRARNHRLRSGPEKEKINSQQDRLMAEFRWVGNRLEQGIQRMIGKGGGQQHARARFTDEFNYSWKQEKHDRIIF
jgi:hypothetical protein